MRISWFFKGSWMLQLLVGVGLFLCSFFIEYKILQVFITPAALALFLSVTLEMGKVIAIVWHYYLNHLSFSSYPGAVRLTSRLFRLGLVALSLLCSQLFLNDRLDRPNLARVKAAETEAVENRLSKDLGRIETLYRSRKAAITTRHKTEYSDLKTSCDQRIINLESLLLAEMDNVVSGVFKGPRYVEFERRLLHEKQACNAAVKQLQQQQSSEIEQLETRYSRQQQALLSTADKKRGQILTDNFTNDERVNDPHITAFLKVTASLFDVTLKPMEFVFVFSLMLSFLMEMGIVLAFSTITVSIVPVLKAQHETALEEEVLMTRVGGEAKHDEVMHQAAMEKIRKAGIRTVNKAKSVLGSPQ
ncbi:MAG: hypothetical protein CR963_00030 [Gammaproteobacteria bacterium]|nr:MAG: hypothetical protein CR963_00030 [Gammaproteobacteria bacterium]